MLASLPRHTSIYTGEQLPESLDAIPGASAAAKAHVRGRTLPTSSERKEPQFRFQWLVVLLVSLAAILAALELGTRIGFRLVSKIESRTMMEAQAARLTQPLVDGKPSMLLVGNSLMLEDVDYPALKRQLAARASVSRFVIEQTYYYDWYFGIRRLFAEGARPKEIVLGIQPSVIPMNRIRGDYSAYYLVSGRDLFDAARAMRYDLTQTSSLAFAHFSLFYAGRNNLRNFILNKLDPRYGELLHSLVTQRAPVVMSAEAARISTERLAAIDRLCRSHGTRFVYFVPPALGDDAESVIAAIRNSGLPVLEPFKVNELASSYFRDGFHLNERGASVLTRKLAEELRSQLSETSVRAATDVAAREITP
jgi:hypothetical protein